MSSSDQSFVSESVDEDLKTSSQICDFFDGQTVLISGATGFLGKVLLCKLLQTCENLKRIFVLIRTKKGQDPQERLQNLLSLKEFNLSEVEKAKVVAVSADMLSPGMGLVDDDKTAVTEETTVVFHCAATINFAEPLRNAVKINCVSLQSMMELAKSMTKLVSFVHCSTQYAHVDRELIEEKFYDPPCDPYKLMNSLEWMDDQMVESMTPNLLGKRPNTYTFTKALAEDILQKEVGSLPICVVRPAIVGASFKDPFPGWIDNINGPTGIFLATATGILRVMHGNRHCVADIVPVDMTTNLLIAAAWHTAKSKPTSIPVYNSGTSSENPLLWKDFEIMNDVFRKLAPLENAFWYPKCEFQESQFMYTYWAIVCHQIPAYLVDIYLRMMGQKPRMVRMYDRINKSMSALKFFTLNEWTWTHHNSRALTDTLSESDRTVSCLSSWG